MDNINEKKCPNCGTAYVDGQSFCAGCGQKINEPAPVAPAVEPAPVAPAVEPAPADPAVEPAPVDPAVEPAPVAPAVEPAPADPVVEPAPVAPAVEPAPVEKRCPNCQALLADGVAFCAECGTSLKKTCPKCGTELAEGQTFCAGCGQKIDAPTPVADTPNPAINQYNAQQKKKSKLPLFLIGGAAVGVVGIVGIIIIVVLFSTIFGSYDFNDEFGYMASEDWCYISSDGDYMKIDTNPDDIDKDSYRFDYATLREANAAYEKVNAEIGLPEYVNDRIDETCYNDGVQTYENKDFKVSWTYHPDQGLEIQYQVK